MTLEQTRLVTGDVATLTRFYEAASLTSVVPAWTLLTSRSAN